MGSSLTFPVRSIEWGIKKATLSDWISTWLNVGELLMYVIMNERFWERGGIIIEKENIRLRETLNECKE